NTSRLILGVRPEHLLVGDDRGASDPRVLCGNVELVEPLGHDQLVHLRVGDLPLIARTDRESVPDIDSQVALTVDADHVHLFDEKTGKTLRN
ncbi:MAG: TOBE domain-containing protein, partial [Gemmatimonadota bacterium]|nr:TOBE domain-containing protein [Gemmatimonadota bacterium]